jgi:hypothetical protein
MVFEGPKHAHTLPEPRPPGIVSHLSSFPAKRLRTCDIGAAVEAAAAAARCAHWRTLVKPLWVKSLWVESSKVSADGIHVFSTYLAQSFEYR